MTVSLTPADAAEFSKTLRAAEGCASVPQNAMAGLAARVAATVSLDPQHYGDQAARLMDGRSLTLAEAARRRA